LDVEWHRIKSPNNSHIFWLIFGEETNELFENEAVKLFLTCDMAVLVLLLRLYDVYKPSSIWKCAWCFVHKDKIGDFDIENWPLRNYEEHKKIGSQSQYLQDKENYANKHNGIKGDPMFKFTWEVIIPCMLHVLMGTVI